MTAWIWSIGLFLAAGPIESFEDSARFEVTGTGKSSLVTDQGVTHGSTALRLVAESKEDAADIRPRGFRWDLSKGQKLHIDVLSTYPGRSLVDVKFFSDQTYLVQQLSVPAGASVVELDLQGVRAHLDATRISILKFQSNEAGRTFYLDNIRVSEPRVPAVETLVAKPKLTTAANMLPNGELDAGLVGFDFWSGEGIYYQKAVTGDAVKSGSAAFRFDFDKPESNGKTSAFIFSGVTPFPAGEYDCSLWVRSDVPGKFRWYWAVQSSGDRDALSGTYWSETLTTQTSWTNYGGRFKVSRPVSMRLYAAVYSPTDFYVDAIQVAPVAASPSQVSVVGSELRINGQSSHVVGIYHGCPTKVAELGIRHHKPDIFPNDEYVRVCQENGIWVWGDLSGVTRTGVPQAVKGIRSLYTQPNIVGWYSDEPDHEGKFASPELLRWMTAELRSTGLPHWAVVMSWPSDSSNAFQYQDSVDIIATDIYPWANRKPLSWLLDKVDRFLRTDPSRPRWVVVEAHRDVPADYQRVMIWLPFVAGADGTWFWETDDISGDPEKWAAFRDNLRPFLDLSRSLPGRATRLTRLPAGLVGSVRSDASGNKTAVVLNLTEGAIAWEGITVPPRDVRISPVR